MNRVVVTGMGAVSPIGNTLYESWTSAKAGISGIAPITRFDASMTPWKMAGEVKGFDAAAYLSLKEITRLDRFVHYAVAAAVMAAEDAGTIDIEKAGVIIGSSRGGISTFEQSVIDSTRSSVKDRHRGYLHRRHVSAYLMAATTISMASSYVAKKLGIKGHCLGVSNACASGANAIGEAYRLIRSGYIGPVLCGGTEAPVCRICMEGYGSSGALSAGSDYSASRPFDRARDGFVLSEGACILVLEELKSAADRGANIYGEITGYGNTSDAFHQTVPSAEGEARAIKSAIEEAGLKPAHIHFISAHGTSTILGDKTETRAIKLVFEENAYQIPVTSVKSSTGHMLAASGAIEAAFTLMSINEGIIPPTINLRERDPECDLGYVTDPYKTEIESAISLSFGFGGVNAVLGFRRPCV
jgi:3-oxoacyl-[acyl-carrier-protein] synthase II